MTLFIPKKTKYNKQHRGRLTGKNLDYNLKNGDYGLIALEPSWITSKQLEACRKIILKATKKIGKFWVNIFPDKPVTMRVPESRMGSGKGNVKFWVAVAKTGTILFEIKYMTADSAIKILNSISYKLPIKTKIINNL
jgi:large subunit ribosomal protein L16